MLAETEYQKDRVERKLQKVRISLMRNPLFARMSGILMLGNVSILDSIPTAATNGRDEVYGRAFIEAMNEKMLGYVVVHENMHKALRHLTTWQKLFKENPSLCNQACDYVINLIITDMDPTENSIAFPRDKAGKRIGRYDVRFRGMHTKQVFDILKKEQEEGSCSGKPGDQPGNGGGGQPQSFDEHDWEGASELTEPEKEQLSKDIDRAIRQGEQAAKRAGNAAGNLGRELSDMQEPQVDWREQLREFVTSICSAKDASSWRRTNRRFISEDVYLPSLVGERVGPILIGADASGSVSQIQLTAGLTEAVSIANNVRPERIDLLYWDGFVASHEVYDTGNMSDMATSTRPQGGGGTSPRCVQEYIKDKKLEPMCIVILTDGEISDWGDDWKSPILWVIVNDNKNIYAPMGKTIHIKE
jgi:predicted metal-dependent peptidase